MTAFLVKNEDAVAQPKGSIIRCGTSPGFGLLAQADSLAHSANLMGVRLTSVPASSYDKLATFGTFPTVLLVGDVADVGNVIYLSDAVAGQCTSVAPPIAISLGFAYEVSSAGGLWYATLAPCQTLWPEVPYDLSCYVAGQPDGTGVLVFAHQVARTFKIVDVVGKLDAAAAADAVWELRVDGSSIAELHWTMGSTALTLVWAPPPGGYVVAAGSTITMVTTTGATQPSDIAVTMKGELP